MDLTKIKGPSFLKELTEKELNDLAKDIRQFIIESVSQTHIGCIDHQRKCRP